jgi:N6-L-threonylcarbamoyladenine synthase
MANYILGIETSCDDTSLCLLQRDPYHILSMRSFSQIDLLRDWGGIVPEIAARNHMEKIPLLLRDLFSHVSITPQELECIAVTTHPGLLGPLLTGVNLAKTLAMVLRLPLCPVNHLFAHLEAIFIDHPTLSYPYLGVLLSGGHSLFALVTAPDQWEILGSTIDDAAGEAFDKAGKLLGLGYPAGKQIDDLAAKGNPLAFPFPIGLKQSADCMMSFSGLKTAMRLHIESATPGKLADVCASYQRAIVEQIALKLRYALIKAKEKQTDSKQGPLKSLPIVVGGGVACNSGLRSRLMALYPKDVFFVRPEYCQDNGAMIANFAHRNPQSWMAYPEHLNLDAHGKFIQKGTGQLA